jgi:hypothetical protein
LLPVEAASGYRQDKLLPKSSIGPGLNTVQPEKNDAGTECRPLVAIDKGVIPAEVIQIRGGNLSRIPVRRFSSKACPGGRHGRFQQGTLSHTVRSAETRDCLGVNLSHDFHGQVEAVFGRGIHASFFIVRA